MKNVLPSFLFLFVLAMGTTAQELPYQFEILTDQTYEPLGIDSSQDLTSGMEWDDPESMFGIGFNWYYMNNSSLQMSFVPFSGFGSLMMVPSNTDGFVNLIVPYYADVIDAGYQTGNSISRILKRTDGNPGSRITKIEWQNVAFWDEYDAFGSATNQISFQMWLYEGTNDVEFHFGPNSIKDFDLIHPLGIFCGMFRTFDPNMNSWDAAWVSRGNPEEATMDVLLGQEDFLQEALTTVPPSGTVYRFYDGVVNINEIEKLEFQLYPTAAQRFTQFSKSDASTATVEVRDITGKLIDQFQFSGDTYRYHVDHLNQGIYLVSLFQDQQMETLKFVKD